MCGIYGELEVAPSPERGRAFADAAEQSLRRGPDGTGRWSDAHCLLGHTRLSILDPAPRSAQPMAAASGRSHLVFNGEVYNYLELREALPGPAAGWRTSGDTEVLLELLDRGGVEALSAAVGMFAIALWRPAERALWLVRDRLGKKPLYLARTPGGGLRFASELGALLADGALPRETTLDRLAEFLQHGYVAAPRTGLCGVEVLPPGCWMRARIVDACIHIDRGRYWRLPPQGEGAEGFPDEGSFLEAFDATLRDAVRIRLRSDVPLGAFLSGGADSSVVSLLASRHLGRPLRTFTVGFREEGYSEAPFASEVARHIGAEHTVLGLGPSSLGTLPELVATYGDLHGDASALPTLALCRAARRHVTVALAGDGGDELLGGYGRYHRTLRAIEAARHVPALVTRGLRFAGRSLLPWWAPGAGRIGSLGGPLEEVYARELWAFAPRPWPALLRRPRSVSAGWPDAVARALDEHRARPPLLRLMACDATTYLPEDILVKVDRASMASGLEVRAPLLDHRLFELVMRADPAWVERKRPLRARYAASLPASVFGRPKQGFGVPLGAWLREGEAAERLLDPSSRAAGLLDRGALRALLRRRRARDVGGHLWQLLVLDAWLDLWRPRVAG